MNSDRWQLVESLFAEAVELDDAELASFLDQNCGADEDLRTSVMSLVARDRKVSSSSFLERNTNVVTESGPERDAMVGKRIGQFEITQRIGSGGMGDVFLGVRNGEFQQQAAIKLIRRGLDSQILLGRFRNEMQFLAAVGQHPNITNILDAGTTDEGQHYIAMDFVNGLRINEYCDEHKLGLRERLQLFCRACDAVQFAHQNAILHRDLKPSNLLVTADGQPMLIDFGVAKLTESQNHDLTQTLNLAFTPDYASPEQIRGKLVTTASDVYSLGIILYELLAGHRPYQTEGQSLSEIVRRVCEDDPLKPSIMASQSEHVRNRDGEIHEVTPQSTSELRGITPRQLALEIRGDLDRIIMKALEKDVARRYQTVGQLTDEIDRYLNGQPIKARGDNLSYLVSKYIRRHKFSVAAALVFLLMLLAGIGITSRLAIRASQAAAAEKEQRILANRALERARQAGAAEKEQRLLAEKREQTANEVVGLFDDVFASANPRNTGDPNYPVSKLADTLAQKLTAKTVEDPVVKARLLHSIAAARNATGAYGEAIINLREAKSLLNKNLGPTHPMTLASTLKYCQAYLLHNDPKMVLGALKRIIDIDNPAREKVPEWNQIQFQAHCYLAEAHRKLKGPDEAEIALVKAESKIALLSDAHRAAAEAQVQRLRMMILMQQGKHQEAYPFVKQEYEHAKAQYGETDYRTTSVGIWMAGILSIQRRHKKAVELHENHLRTVRKLFGDVNQVTWSSVLGLAIAKMQAGQLSEADMLFAEYESLHARLQRYPGPDYHQKLLWWSDCLRVMREFERAEQLLQRCEQFGGKADFRKRVGQSRERLFSAAGQSELKAHWSVAPTAPKDIPDFEPSIDSSGQIELAAGRFVHPATAMKHRATRWQIRAEYETFAYSPTLDVTSTEDLCQIKIPAGVLLPNQKYVWRVAHIGQNRKQSGFSAEQAFSTGELDYQFQPFDLAKHFNRDVVRSPEDESEDAFLGKSGQLLIDGHREEGSSEASHGVPRNGCIGPHQLGAYQELNAIQIGKYGAAIRVELPHTKVKALRFLLASALTRYVPNGLAIEVTLEYADGQYQTCMVNCPDANRKLDYRSADDGLLPANIVRYVDPTHLALFDTMIAVDPTRELVAITIPPCPHVTSQGRINILAITGVKDANRQE